MKPQKLLRLALLTLLVSMLGIGSASAQQAYAYFTESTATLTFRYDKNFANYDYQTGGHAYLLNTGSNDPGWYTDGSCNKVEIVTFDPSFATVRPTTTYRWFYYMENLSEIFGLENLNTSEVTNMDWMFSHCNLNLLKNLTFDTRNVTSMRGMYAYSSGTSFSMNLDTRNVTDMSRMFFNCKQLNVLDLSTINTSNVANMSNMFRGCEKLKTIYVGYEWNQSRAGEHQDMFEGCYAIVGGAGTTYNPQGTDKAFAHVDHGGANPGYLTLNDQYAVFDNGSSQTLTFYCDTNMGERTGTKYYLKRIDAAPAWRLDGTNKLVQYVVFDPSFADARPTGIRRWFWEMEKLEAIAGIRENLDLGEETDLSSMFYGCSALKNVDLSLFDMRNVTDMSSMFAGCSSLTTIYVGKDWNTDMVTSSSNMFAGCTSLVGGQGTTFDANHTNKAYARPDGGSSNPGYLTLGSPYVVINNNVMTFYCDTERSTRSGETYSLNVGGQNPGWLGTYVDKAVFDPSFAAARPSTTARWFYSQPYMESIEGMNEYLNTSEVTNMSSMFHMVTKLTALDLKGFNTEKVTDMSRMFQACSHLQALNLSSFDTYRVQNVAQMFYNCRSLKVIYVGDRWNLDGASESEEMFWDCTVLVGGKGTTYTKAHRDKAYAHVDGGTDNPGYLTTMVPYVVYNDGTLSFYKDMYVTIRPGTAYLLNTGLTPDWYDDKNYKNVTSVVFDPSFADVRPTRTSGWFLEMSNLKSITGMKENLNTSEVESLFGMFYGCSLLESVDVSNFDTQKVTMMNSMFNGCTSLKTLDLSSFNTASVTDMGFMFAGCSNLKTIYVGEGWDAQTVRTTYQMFKDCTSLVGGAGTTYDADHTDGAYAHIDGGPSNPGYLTEKTDLKGDVNGDGQVGIGDIVAITNVMAGIETNPDIVARADVNDDTQVGIGDIVAITNIMAGTE